MPRRSPVPSFARRAAACLVGAAALAHAAGAQAPGRRAADSVDLAPGTRVAARSSGTSIAVLDSADIAASGARTLSELLLARVAGLSVSHRGGSELEGSDVRARGLSSPGAFAPMLVIDGVRAVGAQRVALPGTDVALSRLDDLAPDDVDRIEVLRGPAAAALYGVGASSGVIAVTTRRGAAGPIRLSANAGASRTSVAASFPDNYELTSGAPHAACSLYYRPTNPCSPATLYHFNPLAQASPFRAGYSTTGGASASGTLLGARLFAGASSDRNDGVTSDDRATRTRARASLERELPGALTLRATGGWVRREGSAPARGANTGRENVIQSGLLGTAYDDSVHGYLIDTRNGYSQSFTPAEPTESRTSGAVRLDWRPSAWLSVTALGGRDRTSEHGASRLLQGSINTYQVETTEVGSDEAIAGTMHVGATARWSPGPVAMSTELAYDDVRVRSEIRDSVGSRIVDAGSAGSSQWSRRWQRAAARDATVRQHASWRGIDVDAGLRWSATHGLSTPRAVDAARTANVSYQLPTLPGGATLRLRAAGGVSPMTERGFAFYRPGTSNSGNFGGYYGANDERATVHPRVSEREAGLDLTVGPRADVQLTYYRSQSRDTYLGSYPNFYGGYAVPALGDLRNRGLEARAAARLFDGARIKWELTLTAATLSSRLSASEMPYAGQGMITRTNAGDPVQGYWTRRITWIDANHDGIVGSGEVGYGPLDQYIGSSLPRVEMGVRPAVSIGKRVSIDALFDYRGGQFRENGNERTRCAWLICEGVQDPSRSPLQNAMELRSYSFDQTGAFVERASYVRLREVVIDWDLPGLARATRLGQVGVRVVGQNLATWTRYSGVDPEVGTGTPASVGSVPQELFQSPLSRRVLLELRLGTGLGR